MFSGASRMPLQTLKAFYLLGITAGLKPSPCGAPIS